MSEDTRKGPAYLESTATGVAAAPGKLVPAEPRHVTERWPTMHEDREARLAFLKARTALRLPDIPKGTQGHGYKYASLADVLGAVDGPLREAGFSIRWRIWTPSSKTLGVRCVLSHVDGWYEDAEMVGLPEEWIAGRMNGIQARGAFVTYVQRYTLFSVLGWNPDTDTDGRGEEAERVRDDTPPRGQQRGRRRQEPRRGDDFMGGPAEQDPDDDRPF